MSQQFSEPQIVAQPERHLVVVREKVAFDWIPSLYDRAYPAIFAALGEAGIAPAAAPMGVMHGPAEGTLDLSVAVPVEEPVEFAAGKETDVSLEVLPSGRAATLLVKGDYSQLSAAYEHLFAWIAQKQLTPAGISWEQYLTEPKPGGDPAENETLIGVELLP